MIMMFIPITNITAAEKVKIDSSNFPDENFLNLVEEKFDKNNDGYLGSTEIKNARTLSGVGRDIKSAEGIKFLPNLYYLNLRNNPLETLDLKYNVKMKEIDIIGTKLRNIKNIQFLTKLETMKVSQTWLYNQNLDDIKVRNLEVICKELFYTTARDFMYTHYINRSRFNRNYSGDIYVSNYYLKDKTISLDANNKQTRIRIYFKTKKLVDPNYSFDLTQKTINSVEIKFKKKSQYSGYDSSVDIFPDYYEILRYTSEDGTYKRIKLTTKNNFVHTGITPYKRYYYKIRGYKKQSNGVKVYTKDSGIQTIKTEIAKLCLDHKRANCDCCYSQDYWDEKRVSDADNKNVYKITWVNNKDADGYEVGYMKEINTCGESICHNYSHKSEVFTVITKSKTGSFVYDKKKYNNVVIRAYRYVGGEKQYTWIKSV